MDEQPIAFLVATAFEVGSSLLNFCDSNTSADREFGNFADDVNAFASAWSIIQPSLRDPSVALSPSLLRILGRMSRDGTVILARLRESITTLNSRCRNIHTAATRIFLLRLQSHHKSQRYKLLKEFLGQQVVAIHRSQIIFATCTLNVILVVIHHARAGPTRQHDSLHTHNELHLLREQHRARAKIETEEALSRDPQVRAVLWLPPLPEKGTGPSIFDILAKEWTRQALNGAQRGANYDAGLQRHFEQWARRMQEQEQQIADLNESNERSRQEDRNIIRSLGSRLQEQESRLQEQEQQSRKDGALIAQLHEKCRQWDRYYDSKEGGMERLQTQLDNLTQAYRGQERETQRLQQICQALERENDKLRREKRFLQVETQPLRTDNMTLRDENERVEQLCKRLGEDLLRIRSERDSWRRDAGKLKDRIITQPAMGPTSFPSERSSRRDSSSSRSSGRTYVASGSCGSSKERRT